MAITVNVYNQKAEVVSEEKLSKKIFGMALNEDLVHQAVVAQQANERQVLAHTKDRSEVRGGGRKPWRQKGTGRARVGTIRSPLWIGGGVTFGPRKERNYKKKINKKMKQRAMDMVLSSRVIDNRLLVLEKLEVKEFKTAIMDKMLNNLEKQIYKNTANAKETKKNFKERRSILLINDKKEDKSKFSLRNLEGVKIINFNNINIVDILKYKNLLMTKGAISKLEKNHK